MTAVTIRPTFKKDSRPNNGLEAVSDELQADKTKLFRVVGTVKYAGASVSEEGEITPAAKFVTLEVILDDADAKTVDELIDDRRKERGLSNAKDIPVTGVMVGQIPFDFDDEGKPVTRLGPDGEHVVPPPSAEEELAERAEAKAAIETPEESAAIVDANLRAAGSAGLGKAKPKPTTEPFNPGGADA